MSIKLVFPLFERPKNSTERWQLSHIYASEGQALIAAEAEKTSCPDMEYRVTQCPMTE